MVFRERTFSVLLVSASQKFIDAMAALLPPADFWPVTTARSAGEARRLLAEEDTDLVHINTPLPDEFGKRLASGLCAAGSTGVLLFVKSDLYDDFRSEMMEVGVMVMPKPASAQMVQQTLRLICSSRERMRRMEEKWESVEQKIEEIRLVNRAKWLLIECLRMTEADAHRYIEKQAMDRRLSRRQVAENIIKTYS